jgi:hypothetical protein
MYEPKILESTFDSPDQAEKKIAELYAQGWRLLAVTNFIGRNWFFFEREKKEKE